MKTYNQGIEDATKILETNIKALENAYNELNWFKKILYAEVDTVLLIRELYRIVAEMRIKKETLE